MKWLSCISQISIEERENTKLSSLVGGGVMRLNSWKLKPDESGLVVAHKLLNRVNYSLKQILLNVKDSWSRACELELDAVSKKDYCWCVFSGHQPILGGRSDGWAQWSVLLSGFVKRWKGLWKWSGDHLMLCSDTVSTSDACAFTYYQYQAGVFLCFVVSFFFAKFAAFKRGKTSI